MATILIVDDELPLLTLLEGILEDSGHDVVKATNGQEALVALARQQPDLVISDVMMPIMDGLTLFDRVRSNPLWKTVKFILVSAAPIKTDEGQVKANKIMKKPYNITTMESAVEEVLNS